MKNNFTKEDIKNSIEYQWRKTSLTWLLAISAIIAVVMLFATFIPGLGVIRNIGLSLKIWITIMAVYFALLFPFVSFYVYKMLYILKHFTAFNSYEVMLDNVSTSYAYRGAVYYTVIIDDEGVRRRVNTNPYFSSGFFTKFALEDYNNKKVVGLYDDQADKFYIIKKVG